MNSVKIQQSIASCKTFTLDGIEYSAFYMKPDDVQVFNMKVSASKDVSKQLPIDLYRNICLDFEAIFKFPYSEREGLMGEHHILWSVSK